MTQNKRFSQVLENIKKGWQEIKNKYSVKKEEISDILST
jgi:hypothetical protein